MSKIEVGSRVHIIGNEETFLVTMKSSATTFIVDGWFKNPRDGVMTQKAHVKFLDSSKPITPGNILDSVLPNGVIWYNEVKGYAFVPFTDKLPASAEARIVTAWRAWLQESYNGCSGEI